MRSQQDLIRITTETHRKIRRLAKELNYSHVTVLEYLLDGRIDLDKLK